jgi:hypothetical protein
MFYTLYTSSDDYELTTNKSENNLSSTNTIEQNLCIICWTPEKNHRYAYLIKDYVEYYTVCTCNTYIHEECLKEWYNITNSCPICRTTIEYRSLNTFIVGEQWKYISVFIVVYNYGVRCVRFVSILSIINIFIIFFYMVGYVFYHSYNLDHVL